LYFGEGKCIAGRPKNPLKAIHIEIEGEDEFDKCGFYTFPPFHAWMKTAGSI